MTVRAHWLMDEPAEVIERSGPPSLAQGPVLGVRVVHPEIDDRRRSQRLAALDVCSLLYHTIAEELAHQGTYESAGGLLYLAELNLATPSAAHIEHYARIVLEHAVRRRYIDVGQKVSELAWNRRKDLDTVKQ